jgi:single-strand DNA-binding protein
MNKVILVGRLTRDPETRYTQTGKAVTNITVAVDEGFGENKKTTFVPVVAWEKIAEVIANNLQKGRRVLVEGRLQIQDYEKDGVKKRSTDVVVQNIEFLDSKQGGQANSSPADSMGKEVKEEEFDF